MIKILRGILKKLFYIAFILTVFITPVKANAIEDSEIKGSLEINHTYKETPLRDAEFKIYKVVSPIDSIKYELSNWLEDYPIDYSKLEDKTEWYLLQDSIASYIKVDGLKGSFVSKTDENGIALFEKLNKGLYLVIGEPLIVDNHKYEVKPFLVSLPSKDLTTGELTYNISISTKIRRSPIGEMSLEVQKKWLNDDKKNRPKSIRVSLYNNSELYDTVVLNEEGNWQYKWDNLFNSDSWTIIEDEVPEDYLVSYENYGSVIIVTNTYNGEDLDPLPQTGQSLLGKLLVNLTGVLFIAFGFIIKRRI